MNVKTAAATESASPGPRLRTQRDYLKLLFARLSGAAATQMLMVALGWQMYDLTGSAWQLGLVGLVQFVPALLFTLPAGHLADHHDRRGLLALSLSIQAGVAAWLCLASVEGWVNARLILGLSAGLGMARALQMPALQALTPSLVPPALLPRALAVSSAVMQGAIISGPALGGVLYAVAPRWATALTGAPQGVAHAGAAAVDAVSAVLLGAAVLGVGLIRQGGHISPRDTAPGWARLTAGVRFICQRPVVLGAMSLDMFAVLLGGATALLPIYVRDILHAGPDALGVLRSAPAMGAVGVGLWLARRPIERHTGRWLMGSVALFGLATIAFGLSTLFWPAFLALMVTGAADMVSMVIRQSLVQLETPDAMRGRVGAVNSVFIGASNQLGEFESGATAAWLGPVGSVLMGGVGTLLVVAVWWRLFPGLAHRDRLGPTG
jgi:MFS family permease